MAITIKAPWFYSQLKLIFSHGQLYVVMWTKLQQGLKVMEYNAHDHMGGYNLKQFIFNGFNTSKTPYFNIKIKNSKILKLNANNVVINELTKFKWNKAQINNSLICMLGKNINPIKKTTS